MVIRHLLQRTAEWGDEFREWSSVDNDDHTADAIVAGDVRATVFGHGTGLANFCADVRLAAHATGCPRFEDTAPGATVRCGCAHACLVHAHAAASESWEFA